MLQIGRFLCRGQGAMLVTGPLGAALVPLDFADSAADVVWGRADTQAWLSHVQAEKGDALLLDCAGEQPYLTVLGNIQLRMRAAGQITEQVWTDPIWAWPFNPGEWQTFEATIIDGDEVTWMVPAADRVEAAEIRIGRALDEVEAVEMTAPAGTYLAWLDCSGLDLGDMAPARFFRREPGVAMNPGAAFGRGYERFCRLNLATGRGIAARIAQRLVEAIRVPRA